MSDDTPTIRFRLDRVKLKHRKEFYAYCGRTLRRVVADVLRQQLASVENPSDDGFDIDDLPEEEAIALAWIVRVGAQPDLTIADVEDMSEADLAADRIEWEFGDPEPDVAAAADAADPTGSSSDMAGSEADSSKPTRTPA